MVPAFNEERLIGKTLRGMPWFVDDVFVDDASVDRTLARAWRREMYDSTWFGTRNNGVGAAIVTGYRSARAGCRYRGGGRGRRWTLVRWIGWWSR